MSGQPPGQDETDGSGEGAIEYNVDGEMLTEVEVSDDLPPDDDDESIWTDDGDNVEENEEEEAAIGTNLTARIMNNVFWLFLVGAHLHFPHLIDMSSYECY
jgi:hypothetical protein